MNRDFIDWILNKDTWNTGINEFALGFFTTVFGSLAIVILSLRDILSLWCLAITLPLGIYMILHGIWRDRD